MYSTLNATHSSDATKIRDDPPLFLTHKTRRFRFWSLIRPARISEEQLYVTALWSLSHHKHNQRTPRPPAYRRTPVYGLMVIRPAHIGREPGGQLLA